MAIPQATHDTITKVYSDLQKLMISLYARWQDEKEYEDIADYGKAVERVLPEGVTFIKISKRPFGVHLKTGGHLFSLEVTSSQYRCKIMP